MYVCTCAWMSDSHGKGAHTAFVIDTTSRHTYCNMSALLNDSAVFHVAPTQHRGQCLQIRYAVHAPALKGSAEPKIDKLKSEDAHEKVEVNSTSCSFNQGETVLLRGDCLFAVFAFRNKHLKKVWKLKNMK